MPPTVQGATATTIGKEVATRLVREIATAPHDAPTSSAASPQKALLLGRQRHAEQRRARRDHRAEMAPASVTSALREDIYSFLKTDPLAAGVFEDAAKAGAQLSLTRDPVKLQSSGASITVTKTTFQSIDQLPAKHFPKPLLAESFALLD